MNTSLNPGHILFNVFGNRIRFSFGQEIWILMLSSYYMYEALLLLEDDHSSDIFVQAAQGQRMPRSKFCNHCTFFNSVAAFYITCCTSFLLLIFRHCLTFLHLRLATDTIKYLFLLLKNFNSVSSSLILMNS